MNKLLIAVPSKNRVDTLTRYTWAWAKTLKFDVRVFVEPQDEAKYKLAFPDAVIVNIGANNMGLGYAKKQIHECARNGGYDVIFKLDDDTAGFV